MSFLTIIFLSFGLAMDAFAVSITNGMCYINLKKSQILKMASAFGFLQGFMPLLGYLLGKTFAGFIESIDHYVAFILLSGVGLHMIYEAIKANFSKEETCELVCTNKSIFAQGIATSIDALAVGVGFAVININLFVALPTITIITFITSIIGIYIGKKFRGIFKGPAEIIGGFILIGIGLKLLLDGLI